MRIKRIRWQNYRSLPDGGIDATGKNVTVIGRNGAGKSSIVSTVSFVLFGKIPAKSFDARGLVVESQMPTAEIEFDTVSFKRIVTPRNSNRLFVNGREVKKYEFDGEVAKLTNNTGTLLFNPFEFPTGHYEKQRERLLFDLVGFDEAESLEEPVIVEEALRINKSHIDENNFRMKEVRSQLAEMPTEDAAELEKSLQALKVEFESLAPKDFSREESYLRRQITDLTARVKKLREMYTSVRTTCPTCGQKFPKDRIDGARFKIAAEGKDAAQKLEKARDDLETLLSKVAATADTSNRAKQLQTEIQDLTSRLEVQKNAAKLRKRLAELEEAERDFNVDRVKLEGELAEAEKLRQKRLVDFEQRINSQFEIVKFKLFKQQANGEVKPHCEAMINGVPYANLSKGEKLKAALDILRTFQAKYEVELPLFIDDAESYTPNSFVDVPNQLFLFKVADCDLRVEIERSLDREIVRSRDREIERSLDREIERSRWRRER